MKAAGLSGEHFKCESQTDAQQVLRENRAGERNQARSQIGIKLQHGQATTTYGRADPARMLEPVRTGWKTMFAADGAPS